MSRWRRGWLAALTTVALAAGIWAIALILPPRGGGSTLPTPASTAVAAAVVAHPPGEHDHDEGEGEDGGQDQDADGGQDEDAQPAAGGCDPERLPLHQGAQEGQRCVPTALGELPDPAQLPGVVITSPQAGATLPLGEPFEVAVQVNNLATGNFADPQAEYFAQPQRLDETGNVMGHAHVVVQPLPQDDQVPAATQVAYFEGLDTPAQDGRLTATIPGLDAPGVYRIQVNTASTSHRPIASPVARHLAPVDVIRVRVAQGENEGGQGVAGQALPAAQLPGDGVPPSPRTTVQDEGERAGEEGGPAVGGAGDGVPPPPVTRTPETAGSATPTAPADGLVSAEGGSGVNWLVVGGGLLIFVGAGIAAASRIQRRRPPSRVGYQGRHMQDDLKGTSSVAAEDAAAVLSGELRRLQAPEDTDPPKGPGAR